MARHWVVCKDHLCPCEGRCSGLQPAGRGQLSSEAALQALQLLRAPFPGALELHKCQQFGLDTENRFCSSHRRQPDVTPPVLEGTRPRPRGVLPGNQSTGCLVRDPKQQTVPGAVSPPRRGPGTTPCAKGRTERLVLGRQLEVDREAARLVPALLKGGRER